MLLPAGRPGDLVDARARLALQEFFDGRGLGCSGLIANGLLVGLFRTGGAPGFFARRC